MHAANELPCSGIMPACDITMSSQTRTIWLACTSSNMAPAHVHMQVGQAGVQRADARRAVLTCVVLHC